MRSPILCLASLALVILFCSIVSSESLILRSRSVDSVPSSLLAVRKRLCRAISPALVAASLWYTVGAFPQPSVAAEWQLWNGNVLLSDPLTLPGITNPLNHPQLIGAGGGGAVFAFEDSSQLVKVSWEGSTKSVQRECQTLKLLEEKHVTCPERCLGEFSYQSSSPSEEEGDARSRVMILVEPYVSDAVASIAEVSNPAAQRVAIQEIAKTLVQMVASQIVTIDVQPLISKNTGHVLFIDMTEAQVLRSPLSSSLDQALLSGFVNEMVALIPEDKVRIASDAVRDEIKVLEEKHGIILARNLRDLLQSQTPFLDAE